MTAMTSLNCQTDAFHPHPREFSRSCRTWCWVALIQLSAYLLACEGLTVIGADSPTAESSFSLMLTSQTRQTFDQIRISLSAQPLAVDAAARSRWVVTTSREFGWESEAVEAATWLLKSQSSNPADQRLALLTLAVAAAREDRLEDCKDFFGQYLASLRLRQPNTAAEAAQTLALAWQLRGNLSAANEIYEQLRTSFFLNEELRSFTDSRRARLKLVGLAAPSFDQTDLQGKTFDWSTYRGKTVLLDFWATNCRPCLDELPRLKHQQAEWQPLGVDVVGISFDEAPETLQTFVEEQRLPWRQVLGRRTAETDYFVEFIPCLMLVDTEGVIRAVDLPANDVRGALSQLRKRGKTP